MKVLQPGSGTEPQVESGDRAAEVRDANAFTS